MRETEHVHRYTFVNIIHYKIGNSPKMEKQKTRDSSHGHGWYSTRFVYSICGFVHVHVRVYVTSEELKEWWCNNKLQSMATAGMQIGCSCPIHMIFTLLTYTRMYIHSFKHTTSLLCQPLVIPGYLTWPSQAAQRCQRQCSCCNLGQAIYKESSQVQAQGPRGRQREGRIKEYLQGRETELQGIGEKEQWEQRSPERQHGEERIKVVSR